MFEIYSITSVYQLDTRLALSFLANLEEYLESVKGSPDPELSKKAFEKKNLKSNANIVQLQKKLDKYQKALKVR